MKRAYCCLLLWWMGFPFLTSIRNVAFFLFHCINYSTFQSGSKLYTLVLAMPVLAQAHQVCLFLIQISLNVEDALTFQFCEYLGIGDSTYLTYVFNRSTPSNEAWFNFDIVLSYTIGKRIQRHHLCPQSVLSVNNNSSGDSIIWSKRLTWLVLR